MEQKDTRLTKRPSTSWRYYLFLLSSLLLVNLSIALPNDLDADTLKLSQQQFEELFLKQNLLLLAEQFNIEKADALLLQSKLWPNPSITIEEVNLWATNRQISALDTPLPPIFGNVGKNTQFSVQVEQLIKTAGKRKKQIKIEETAFNMAQQEFEYLLRTLRLELRKKLIHLRYLQLYEVVFIRQRENIRFLLNSYEHQVFLENVSRGEFIRLKGLKLELSQKIAELNKEHHKIQANLKMLLNIDGPIMLMIHEERLVPPISQIKRIRLEDLYIGALEIRPDLKLASLQYNLDSQHFKLEKARRIPDINIIGNYDRGGGIWPSFLSFGISVDIPLFDRNQGNIKHARLSMDQSKVLLREKELTVKVKAFKDYTNLLGAVELYESIEPDYEGDLDKLLDNYTKNFANRNINLLEYLDFQNAYVENKKIILESVKDIELYLEELKHTTGLEIENHE